ncbi:MAG: DUF2149 domain-containing protein [Firmicutes bacterium]|nr:DUF2149 domain-containing protein [Bacillota bacterium]
MRLTGKRGRLRVERSKEDFSPMEGVGNMADAMLVFACGILLALIMSWNIDVSDRGEITKSPETKYEVQGMEDGQVEEVDTNKNLEEMGKVYKDSETGKYYVVEE